MDSEPTRRGSFWVASFPRGGSKHPALKRVRGFFPVEAPAPRDANIPWGAPPSPNNPLDARRELWREPEDGLGEFVAERRYSRNAAKSLSVAEFKTMRR